MTTRILIVDDHEMMRDGLRAVLEKEPGFHVVGEAASGREAVQQAADLGPDVVIMDVAMQDLNGVEATRQIKAQNGRIQVVALSSHSDRRYVTAILRAGAAGYVLKGNAYDQLRQAVRAVRAGRSFLCEEVAGAIVETIRRPEHTGGSAFDILGPREREVLQLLAEGATSGEIAERLHVATSTVETHRRNVMRKLDLHSVAALTKYAIREGITSLEG